VCGPSTWENCRRRSSRIGASPLLDGDLPLDISIDVEPLDLAWAKLQLDARRNALESSAPTPGRQVALEQIAGLRMAYERRQTLPMRMAVTVVVGGPDRHPLERRTKRLRQRVKDLDAELRLLRWEQRAGWLAVDPLRRPPLPRRGLPVETGTVARTYPWSAGAGGRGRGAVRSRGLHRCDVDDGGTPQ